MENIFYDFIYKDRQIQFYQYTLLQEIKKTIMTTSS